MMNYGELERRIQIEAEEDSNYAIAWALLQIADKLSDIESGLSSIARALREEQD